MAATGRLGDVPALGEHGHAVRHDPLDRDPGERGHAVRRVSGPDPGLDVTRTQGAVHLNLQLSESGAVSAQSCAQPLVCGGEELDAGVVDVHDLTPVAAEADEPEVAHVPSNGCLSSSPRLPGPSLARTAP
jgi:hypothetical protein